MIKANLNIKTNEVELTTGGEWYEQLSDLAFLTNEILDNLEETFSHIGDYDYFKSHLNRLIMFGKHLSNSEVSSDAKA